MRSHPGNVSFRQDFIQKRSAKYNAAQSRDEKNEIADEILRDIAGLSRQFLKQHPSGYWTELPHKVAKEKVMMAFREYRKSQKLEGRNNRNSTSAVANAPPSFHQQPLPPFPPSHHYPSPHPHPYPYHHPAYAPPPFLPYPPDFAASAGVAHHPHHFPAPAISSDAVTSPGRRPRPQEDQATSSDQKRFNRDSV